MSVSKFARRDTDPLRHVAVQHRILTPLSLLIVLPVVSSAIFLPVRPSLIAVGFGLSFQLLSCGFSSRHGVEKAAVGRGRRREKKARVADQNAGTMEWASTPSSICLSDPQGRDEVVARDRAQNSVKK